MFQPYKFRKNTPLRKAQLRGTLQKIQRPLGRRYIYRILTKLAFIIVLSLPNVASAHGGLSAIGAIWVLLAFLVGAQAVALGLILLFLSAKDLYNSSRDEKYEIKKPKTMLRCLSSLALLLIAWFLISYGIRNN